MEVETVTKRAVDRDFFRDPFTWFFIIVVVGILGLVYTTSPALSPGANPVIVITSPPNGAVVEGSVDISFLLTNWAVGSVGQPHIRFFLDNDPEPYVYYSQGLDSVFYRGVIAENAEWIDEETIRFTNLDEGRHTVRVIFAVPSNEPIPGGAMVRFSVGIPYEEEVAAPEPVVVNDENSNRMFENERVTFVYDNAEAYVGVVEVMGNSVVLDVNTRLVEVGIGEHSFDISDDGIADVSISINDIDGSSVALTVAPLIAPKRGGDIGGNAFGFILVIVSILLVVAVVFFYLVRVFTKD